MAEIIQTLTDGGIVVLPTETAYLTAIDATNPKAVQKLCEYKKRPLGKPFSVAVSDMAMAEEYVELNKQAIKLYNTFLPGPVTVVSKGKHKTAPGIESELGTLGIRIPDYQLVIDVVKQFGKPVTATSANKSYEKRPYKIADLDIEKFDLIIDAGELPHNEPSTVIDTTMDDLVVLRQGEVVISNQLSVVSYNEEMTKNTGKELWQKYEKFAGHRAIVFALEGEMGAGKTVFTKGLARAMGIDEVITSPTFNIELVYKNLHHIDAWRMQNGDELEQLGLAGTIHDKSVLVIEWADRVADTIRKYNDEAVIIWVKILYGKADNERLISWGTL